MADQKKIVWIISDGTGRSAAQLIKAAAYQFNEADLEYRILKDVTSEEKIHEIIKRVKDETGMIVYTVVSKSNRRLLSRLAMENHILAVDLFGPLISTLQKFLEKVPLEMPGLTYMFNRDYFRMMDAVDFTVKHDDGAFLDDVDKADIILIGPSRVGKTPLAIYLAYTGWKVANIPIIKDNEPPDMIKHIPFKVICLITEPSMLQVRRIERIKKMGDPNITGYTDLKSINEEIEFCKRLSRDGKNWPLIDVSNRPIEDVAKEIIQLVSV